MVDGVECVRLSTCKRASGSVASSPVAGTSFVPSGSAPAGLCSTRTLSTLTVLVFCDVGKLGLDE